MALASVNMYHFCCAGDAGDGRQGKWEATGHIVKLQDSSEEVTMELRDSQKLPIDTTTGCYRSAAAHCQIMRCLYRGMHRHFGVITARFHPVTQKHKHLSVLVSCNWAAFDRYSCAVQALLWSMCGRAPPLTVCSVQ